MFTQPRTIRCKKCRRVFSDYADHCPECHKKTPRGWIAVIIPILSVLLTIATITLAIYFLSNAPDEM